MNDRELALREAVRDAYTAIARDPQQDPPFPIGRELAESLGYPSDLLDSMPSSAVEAFCGVSATPLFADIIAGASIVEIGCGAGLDTLIAARRAGPTGAALGVDFSEAMLERACSAAREAEASNASFIRADTENLPLADSSVDMAIVNGIFNLNPAREQIFRELARVVRQGGFVYASELVLSEPLPESDRLSPANWFR